MWMFLAGVALVVAVAVFVVVAVIVERKPF